MFVGRCRRSAVRRRYECRRQFARRRRRVSALDHGRRVLGRRLRRPHAHRHSIGTRSTTSSPPPTTATGLTLDLPTTRTRPTHDYTDRTAGAVAHAAQIPLATLSGWVYHDRSDDGVFNRGTEARHRRRDARAARRQRQPAPASRRRLRPIRRSSASTNSATCTPARTACAKSSRPAGSTARTPPATTAARPPAKRLADVDRIIGAVLNFGDHAVEYNFGELLPGSISGRVHADEHEDCNFDEPEILLEGVRIDLLDAQRQLHPLHAHRRQRRVRIHRPRARHLPGPRASADRVLRRRRAHRHRSAALTHDVPGVFSIFTRHRSAAPVSTRSSTTSAKRSASSSRATSTTTATTTATSIAPAKKASAGVVLKLLDANGNDTGMRATTDANGYYKFTNLAKGTYTVVEVHPVGLARRQRHARQPGRRRRRFAAGRQDQPDHDQLGHTTASSTTSANCCPVRSAAASTPTTAPTAISTIRITLLEGVQIDLLDAQGNVIAHHVHQRRRRVRVHRPAPWHLQRPRASADAILRRRRTRRLRSAARRTTCPACTASSPASTSAPISHGIQYDFCEKPPVFDQRPRARRRRTRTATSTIPKFCSQACGSSCSTPDGNVVATTLTDVNGEYHFTVSKPANTRSTSISRPATTTAASASAPTAARAIGVDTILQLYHWHRAARRSTPSSTTSAKRSASCSRATSTTTARTTASSIARRTKRHLRRCAEAARRERQRHRSACDDRCQRLLQVQQLQAGTYSVMEVHPTGWLDGIDTPGNLGGVADCFAAGRHDQPDHAQLGHNGVEYNFGEMLPGSIRGRVHADDEPDCDFDDPHNIARRRADRLARWPGQRHRHDVHQRRTASTSSPACGPARTASASISRSSTSTAASASAPSAAHKHDVPASTASSPASTSAPASTPFSTTSARSQPPSCRGYVFIDGRPISSPRRTAHAGGNRRDARWHRARPTTRRSPASCSNCATA